ncbi:MAG: bifunctional 5,10-methylene-tetrahydrofolate dehydrogenase/5,10-methylene-tetrahydrofolate cyclohydrolase [Ignavibacteriae bacterium]|nr:bifunctional 5,10-methylene-tetrahydrofolate dehydrogenase/5,10-methylene-tetrahydrofolate cyclohydrolase [Ignavibacteriota bacterium]
MAAQRIEGKPVAEQIKNEVREGVAQLIREKGVRPGLGVILVGEDPASQTYVNSKGKACADLGMHSETIRMPADATEAAVLAQVHAWNADPLMHGILVQMPLPKHIHEQRVIEAIDPRKDVDGFHPVNVGRLVIGMECLRPCTPAGIQELLVRSGNDPGGKHVVVVGRSNIVGKPIANILLQKAKGANAVVTIAHTGMKDIRPFIKQADILIAAVGRPESITGAMLKPGCVVIDVGINRINDPSLPKGYRNVGDVHFASAAEVASAITPVPGGVGLMTIAMLMQNTLLAARRLSC